MNVVPMKQSQFLKHIPCESCGSSDGNSLYDDGHEYCHVCLTYKSGDVDYVVQQPTKATKMHIKGEPTAILDRGISKNTCEFYGVTVEGSNHYYPYANQDGAIIDRKSTRLNSSH